MFRKVHKERTGKRLLFFGKQTGLLKCFFNGHRSLLLFALPLRVLQTRLLAYFQSEERETNQRLNSMLAKQNDGLNKKELALVELW